jgi:hypothetical protein
MRALRSRLAGVAIAALAVVPAGVAIAALTAPASDRPLPAGFFGIVPQTPLSARDAARMRAGGVQSVRYPVIWDTIQPSPRPAFNWVGLDQEVATTARDGLTLLPFLYGTPHWAAGRPTTLPVANGRQRRAWAAFLRAAVERYGSDGTFWSEHARGSGDYVPRRPIHMWQIWNEENFFYFALPVSPAHFGSLLKLSHRAIASADPRASILAGGLFGNPRPRPPRGMRATEFLSRLYRVSGVRAAFDGVALHPYVPDIPRLRQEVTSLRRVIVDAHDRRTGLYLTEFGWGSQPDPRRVAFEVGLGGQARELRQAYGYLIANRRRLDLKQTYWFSWKDASGICNFCDSAGLFREGRAFRPKPAWHAFVSFARR